MTIATKIAIQTMIITLAYVYVHAYAYVYIHIYLYYIYIYVFVYMLEGLYNDYHGCDFECNFKTASKPKGPISSSWPARGARSFWDPRPLRTRQSEDPMV